VPTTHATIASSALAPGDHACLPYVDGPEVDQQVARFLAQGIAQNEQCLLVSKRSQSILAQMHALGISVTEQIDRAALLVMDPVAFYHQEDTALGVVLPPAEISLGNLVKAAEAARVAGFRCLRGAAGLTTFDRFGLEDFRRYDAYETRVTEVLRQTGTTGLCLYDRRNGSDRSLEIMLRTHPHAMVDGQLRANVFCEPCAQPADAGADAARIAWILDALTHGQAPLLVAEVAHLRERARTHVAEVESRNGLLQALSRRLDGPFQRLSQILDQLADGTAPGNWPERLRDATDGIGHLSRQLRAASDQLARNERAGSAALATVNLGNATSAALDAWVGRQEGGRPEVTLRLNASTEGRWDRARIEAIVTAVLDATWERAWGTRIDLQVDDLGSRGRVSASYGDMEVMAGHPLEAGPQEQLLVAAQDQLRIALWVARENARLAGGTLGMSVWPDGRVSVTVDLPKTASPTIPGSRGLA
jgi:hypothetical protein